MIMYLATVQESASLRRTLVHHSIWRRRSSAAVTLVKACLVLLYFNEPGVLWFMITRILVIILFIAA